MQNPFYYRSVIHRLTRLVGRPNPDYIRLRAVAQLLRELDPGNPRAAANIRMLREVDAFEFARHKLRDLYDRADSLVPSSEESHRTAPEHEPVPSQEEQSEEDDDPL